LDKYTEIFVEEDDGAQGEEVLDESKTQASYQE
jgi:hypothetical protein